VRRLLAVRGTHDVQTGCDRSAGDAISAHQLGRVAEDAAHVLAEEDEDAAVEKALGEADEAAAGAGEAGVGLDEGAVDELAVVETLVHGGAVVLLAELPGVESGADVLELAEDLGDGVAALAEAPQRQIGEAGAAGLARAGHLELRAAGVGVSVRSVPLQTTISELQVASKAGMIYAPHQRGACVFRPSDDVRAECAV
jgi:hypothetical protein